MRRNAEVGIHRPLCVWRDLDEAPGSRLGSRHARHIEIDTHVTDWRDEIIYQVLVDRFANGDLNNDYNLKSNLKHVHYLTMPLKKNDRRVVRSANSRTTKINLS